MIKVNDIFYSVQGEGILTGMPSKFIRLAACNLRCVWCDTKKAAFHSIGQKMEIDDIMVNLENFVGTSKYVVLTGGEPMISKHIEELTKAIKSWHYHLTIETNGTVYKDVSVDLLSISPKLSNSGVPDDKRVKIDVLRRLINKYNYQLKFPIDEEKDLAEMQQILDNIGTYADHRVLLMPVGIDNEEIKDKLMWLTEVAKKWGYRLSDRLQIRIFGHMEGT